MLPIYSLTIWHGDGTQSRAQHDPSDGVVSDPSGRAFPPRGPNTYWPPIAQSVRLSVWPILSVWSWSWSFCYFFFWLHLGSDSSIQPTGFRCRWVRSPASWSTSTRTARPR